MSEPKKGRVPSTQSESSNVVEADPQKILDLVELLVGKRDFNLINDLPFRVKPREKGNGYAR